MRKVILFLVVFGLGFALLWKLRGDRPDRAPLEQTSSQKSGGEFTDVPLPKSPDAKKGEAQQVSVILHGALALTQRGKGATSKPELELRAANVNSLGGEAYDLEEVEVQMLDPETGRERAHLTAPLAHVELALDQGAPKLSTARAAKLQNVTLIMREGVPVAPLTFKTSVLDWSVADKRFTTDEHVVITGEGLEAEGTGLDATLGDEKFELRRAATVKLRRPDGAEATLESGATGPIVMRRVLQAGAELVDITASEGAKLVAKGPEPLTIRARTIHMLGRIVRGPPQSFEIVSADATGDVDADSRGDRFKSQHADFVFAPTGKLQLATLDGDVVLGLGDDEFRSRAAVFEFDAKGELSRAELTGDPTGSVLVARYLPAHAQNAAQGKAEISGAGPLVVTRGADVSFDIVGPARILMRDEEFDLTASKRISGKAAQGDKNGELHALGAVVTTWLDRKLETDALDLDYAIPTGGAVVVNTTTTGATHVTGRTKEGRDVDLTARSGMTTQTRGRALTIKTARDVDLNVGGADGFHAEAGLVRDLVWETRTFSAENDVSFEGPDGDGRAAKADVRGPRDVVLYGVSGAPAKFHSRRSGPDPRRDVEVWADALQIHAKETHVDAEGDAHVTLETPSERLTSGSNKLEFEIAPEGLPGSREPRLFHAQAEGSVVADIHRASDAAHIESDWLRMDGRLEPAEEAGGAPRTVASQVRARGHVHAVYTGREELDARGDLFTIDEKGHGRLAAGAGRRVEAHGKFAGATLPYRMGADWIEFDPDHLKASQVRVQLEAVPAVLVTGEFLHEMRARSLDARADEIMLTGAAHVDGWTAQAEPWSIDAESIRVRGNFKALKSLTSRDVKEFDAEGGFHAVLGSRVTADGDRLQAVPGQIDIEGRPGHISLLDAEWRSNHVHYDMAKMLLSTDRGEITSAQNAAGPSWSLEYESMQPFDQGDTTILVLRNPRLRFGSTQMFADWTLFWVDRDKWQQSGRHMLAKSPHADELHADKPEAPIPHGTDAKKRPRYNVEDKFAKMRANPIGQLMSEAYAEGNVEIYRTGERTARASAVYLDLIEGHGWIQDADVQVDVGGKHGDQRIRARAGWMRMSPDGTLRADKAILTSCDYDEPHYVIETDDLRLTPRQNTSDERVKFGVSAHGNAIRFGNSFAIPLPPIAYETDEEGNPLIDRFVLGDSAKYGASVAASLNADLGTVGLGIGKVVGIALGLPDLPVRGHWHYNFGYLGSRGVLLGAGLDLRLGDKFKFTMSLDGIPDRESDSGIVRVNRDDRSLLRDWFRARGRYTIQDGDNAEWVDIAISHQSDAGVQSEFFEKQYIAYEQKDNFLHWRKASGSDYFNASAKVLIEDRTDTAELPSIGAFRGRTKVGELFEKDIYYTGTADAAYLRRHDGDPRYYDPFPDGLGDREVARFDTQHRLELPLDAGFAGVRATPWVGGRGTAWSEGVDPNSTPGRAALLVGVEATTTFWKRLESGNSSTISPTIGVHGDVAHTESGGDPVRFDGTEDPYFGRVVDFGVRTRWWKPEAKDRAELEVRTSYGDGLDGNRKDGFQPIAVLGEYYTFFGKVPFGLVHDGRYDTQTGLTNYSNTGVGFEPVRDVGIELGYHTGRDQFGERLYEAASAGVRWRWTTKWEIEAAQTESLLDNQRLGTQFILRRIGHDFVLDIEFGYVAGEGARFSFNVIPRFTWTRSSIGVIDRWLGVYH